MAHKNNQYVFQKHKRRLIKPRNMKKIGDYEGGKLCYPHSIKSTIEPYDDYRVRKFYIHTHYHSVFTGDKIPVSLGFWHFTDADTLNEYIGLHSDDMTLFVKEGFIGGYDNGYHLPNYPNHRAKEPRKIVVPHRKTLDNYGLNISLFQKDNYLGVPVCVSSTDKKNVTEGWIYAYNTVVDGVEGIYFEVDSILPCILYGNIHYI